MTRLLAAAVVLIMAAAPAFACEFQKSVSTDTQKRTVASQHDHSTPPPSATTDRKPS
jgi:hypothetical protein